MHAFEKLDYARQVGTTSGIHPGEVALMRDAGRIYRCISAEETTSEWLEYAAGDGLVIADEFTNTGGDITWLNGGSGAIAQASELHHPGVNTFTPSASAADYKILFSDNVFRADGFRAGSSLLIIAKMDAAWDGTDTGNAVMGLAEPSFGSQPNNGVYFFQEDTLGSNWHAVSSVGGVHDEQDTGVAVDDTFKAFRIDFTHESARWYIDDVLVHEVAVGSLPTALLARYLQCSATNTTAGVRTYSIDVWRQNVRVDR